MSNILNRNMNRLNYMVANIKLAALHLDLISATCLTLFLTPSPLFAICYTLWSFTWSSSSFKCFARTCCRNGPQPNTDDRCKNDLISIQTGRTCSRNFLASIWISSCLRRRAARLKCALAGFFEEQPILQHFTTILILQLPKTVDSKLQLTLSNSGSNKLLPLIPLKGSLSICTFCTSLSDADTRLVVFQQLCTCRSFLPVAFPLRKALQQGAAAQGGFGAPRVIVVLSRPFVDSRLILCSLGLATLRLIGWSIGPRRLAFEAFELALVAMFSFVRVFN